MAGERRDPTTLQVFPAFSICSGVTPPSLMIFTFCLENKRATTPGCRRNHVFEKSVTDLRFVVSVFRCRAGAGRVAAARIDVPERREPPTIALLLDARVDLALPAAIQSALRLSSSPAWGLSAALAIPYAWNRPLPDKQTLRPNGCYQVLDPSEPLEP